MKIAASGISSKLIAVLAVSVCAAGVASAQTLPDEPTVFGRGRVVLGGDVAVSVAPEDEGELLFERYEELGASVWSAGCPARLGTA